MPGAAAPCAGRAAGRTIVNCGGRRRGVSRQGARGGQGRVGSLERRAAQRRGHEYAHTRALRALDVDKKVSVHAVRRLLQALHEETHDTRFERASAILLEK